MLSKTLFRKTINSKLSFTSIRTITASLTKTSEAIDRIKAWQIHSYGEEIVLSNLRYPIITQPSQVLVDVEAASVNPIDVAMQNGYGETFLSLLRSQGSTLPLTLGRDFCGTIIDKGHGVSKNLRIGDRVYGVIPFNKDGSHAEVAIAEQTHLCRLPNDDSISHIQAASIPYAALTAWSALWIFGGLTFQNTRGKHVLILGASGGVGTLAAQMLKAKGAYVSATCSQNAIPLLEKFNVDAIYDYNHPEFNQNVAATGRFDIILDCAKFGHENIPSSWQYSSYITLNSPLLKDTDRYGLIGGLASCISKIVPANLSSIPQGRLIKWAYVVPCENGMRFIDNLVQNKQLTATIDSVFSFKDTQKAYEKVKEGHLRGKVVIDMLSDCDTVDNVDKKQ